jgi:hypothetical protein
MLRIPEMKTFSYSRSLGAALIGIAVTAARYAVSIATVGAASVELPAKYPETERLGVSL